MKKVFEYVKMISPFNHMDNIPPAGYILKKLLAFFMIYLAAGIVGEGIIIAILQVAGYDVLHGVMPSDKVFSLLMYYGYVIYIAFTILYCKWIEKRKLSSIGFTKRILDYVLGIGIAVALLTVIMAITCGLGGLSYIGVGKNIDIKYMLLLLGGFMLQGAGEEILCRGFLMTTLQKKVGVPLAVFISSTAFAFPHFSTLFEADTAYAIIGTVNLYLVSILFSLLVLQRKNLWISCGLHSVWNFMLYGVFGLALSGNEGQNSGMICFQVAESSIINGGLYGIEASVITTLVLGMVVAGLCCFRKKHNE